MVCIYCSSKTQVANSRPSKKSSSTWRRRQCLVCGAIFTTREQPDYHGSIRVSNITSKALRPFARDKLFVSIYLSLSHRKTALPDAEALTATIIGQLVAQSSNGIINVTEITATSLKTLNNFDRAGATFYAAHHTLGNGS